MRGIKRVLCSAVLVVLGYGAFFPITSTAAINQQINFQGKLTNPDGTNVPSGSYSIRFRIYTDASLDATNACLPGSNTCKWEDTESISVTDGIFSYALGSDGTAPLPGSVDFDAPALYLGIKVGTDAEMSPRIQLTAAPYAFNSNQLGGISSTGFVQLGQISGATGQTDGSTNTSIYVNKNNAAGNILVLQKAASDVFVINNTGNISATGTYNNNTFTSSALQFGASSTATIQSAASQALNIIGHGNSTVTTDGGTLSLQGFGTTTISSASQSAASTNSANIVIATGNASGATSTSGSVSIDNGSSTSGAPQISIGATNSRSITLGNTSGATTIAQFVGNGTNAFSVQGASSAVYVQLDTTNNRLYVGNPSADGTAFLFVLDSKNTSGDPGSAVGGSEYYNSADGKFRCYENGYWSDCMTTRYLGGTTLGSAANTISVSLAANVEYLHCRLDVKGRSVANMPYLRFNNDSGVASYGWNAVGIVATAGVDWQDSSDSEIQLSGTQTGTTPFSSDINITNFSDTNKVVDWSAAGLEAVGANSAHYDGTGGFYSTGSQISSVQFVTSSGNFTTGSRAWCEGR